MNNNSNHISKVTNSIINKVVIKRWNDSIGKFEIIHSTENMPFTSFIQYLDNISFVTKPNWSIDYLDLEHTTATVYLEF